MCKRGKGKGGRKILLTGLILTVLLFVCMRAGNVARAAENTIPVTLDPEWEYADYSKIHSGSAVLYRAEENRKEFIVGVNAGHGTKGGTSEYTYCHPDMTPKLTGGSTTEGAVQAIAVSDGMAFPDGTSEAVMTLKVAQVLKDLLLKNGYDVLMIRDGEDVQLDNVARTVICNNTADCHIAIHFDGDRLDYDKGCFFISIPEGLKEKEPVCYVWETSEKLGKCLVEGLSDEGVPVYGEGAVALDLTQNSYSSVPSVDIELGNQCSDCSDAAIAQYAAGLFRGVQNYVKQ